MRYQLLGAMLATPGELGFDVQYDKRYRHSEKIRTQSPLRLQMIRRFREILD